MDGADSTINLENQVCYGFSWKDIPDDKLRYYVISRLLQLSSEKKDKFSLHNVLQIKGCSRCIINWPRQIIYLVSSSLNDSNWECNNPS